MINYWKFPSSFFSSKFGNFSLVEPRTVSPAQPVPDGIPRPPWADSGIPNDPPVEADRKSPEDLSKMRRACRLASKILHSAKHLAKASIWWAVMHSAHCFQTINAFTQHHTLYNSLLVVIIWQLSMVVTPQLATPLYLTDLDAFTARCDHRGDWPAGAPPDRRARCLPISTQLPRLPQVGVHLGQQRGLPRHPRRPATAGRRHRQHRRHRESPVGHVVSWRHVTCLVKGGRVRCALRADLGYALCAEDVSRSLDCLLIMMVFCCFFRL